MNIGIREIFRWLSVAVGLAMAVVAVGCGDDNGVNSGDESVVIGGQRWMKKNLNIETPDSWCYGNSADSCSKYGRLYTWEAAMTACPTGWRLPSIEDWDKLAESVGGERDPFASYGGWYYAGKKLKSKTGWRDKFSDGDYSGNGTDNYAFSARPGGVRYVSDNGDNANYFSVGYEGYWWTATEGKVGGLGAISCVMENDNDELTVYNAFKRYGHSVRCIEDK